MGVPGFFKWLLRKNKRMLVKQLNFKPNILYIDANCLFHPQCFNVLEKYNKEKIEIHKELNHQAKMSCEVIEDLESVMIDEIIKYIEYIIKISNTSCTYIAVDGCAPASKLNQQRKRRYMSHLTNKFKLDIKKKYNKEDFYEWSNTVITPGTIFMEKLHLAIINYINQKRNIIYSSYHTPSEGEHKILQHIKNNHNTNIVIYGLDADLIFLSMASYADIHLMRESNNVFFS